MAFRATYFGEELRALLGFWSGGELSVTRWGFAGSEEAREVINVGEAVRARLVVGLGDGIANVGYFIRLEAAGDTHLIEVSIGGKGQETGLLVFPAETADGGLAGSFNDGNVKHLTADFVMAFVALLFCQIHKRLIGHGFYKAVSQNIGSDSEGANVLRIRHALLNLRRGKRGIGANGAVVYERAALDDLRASSDGNIRIFKLAAGAAMADAQLRNLA